MDFIPRAFAVSYCDILNNFLSDFISNNQDLFTRTGDGEYVFSGENSKTRLTKMFSEMFSQELSRIASFVKEKYKDTATVNVFVIQGASPEGNVLKNQFTGKIVPCRYFLTEKDIHIDLALFEGIWNKIFDQKFRMKQRSRNHGIFFLKHQNLNADQLGNVLGSIFEIVEWGYERKRNVLEDLAETTSYEYDGSETMHQQIRLVLNEAKDYIRQITHLTNDCK